MNTKDKIIEKTCPRCGKKFPCGTATGSCWCMDIKLSKEALQHLKNNYPDCLCPDCLPAFKDFKAEKF